MTKNRRLSRSRWPPFRAIPKAPGYDPPRFWSRSCCTLGLKMHTVTCQWTKEDWDAWYQLALEGAEYRDQFRNYQTGWAIATGFVGLFLSLALRFTSSWLVALGIASFCALVGFALCGAFLLGYARFKRSHWLREVAKEYQAPWTLVLMPDSLRILMENSEHRYAWHVVEEVQSCSYGFVRLCIEGRVWHLPPSAFSNSIPQGAFLESLQKLRTAAGSSGNPQPWWRQHQRAGG